MSDIECLEGVGLMCTKRIRKEVELEDIHGKEKKTKIVNFRPSIENMR